MIHEAIQLKPKVITQNIEIKAEFCGKIIGKGGENLRDIREKSGTRIQINKEPVNGDADMRLCEIEGMKIVVKKSFIPTMLLYHILYLYHFLFIFMFK